MFLPREMREMYGRVRQIGRHFDLRHGDATDARIFDVIDEQVSELALDLVGHAFRALRMSFHRVNVRETGERRARSRFTGCVTLRRSRTPPNDRSSRCR